MIFFNQTEITIATLVSFLILVTIKDKYKYITRRLLIYLGTSVPKSIIFVHLVSQKFLPTDIMDESRGVLVSPVWQPGFDSAIIGITTLFYILLVPLESCRCINQIT